MGIKIANAWPGFAADQSRTLHSIQTLRALAALLVVLYHGQLAFSTRVTDPGFVGESYIFAFGAVGVHIFFVISGFIMVFTSRFETGFDAKAFMRRRLLRIYPIYWFCAGLYFVSYALMGIAYNIDVKSLIGALLLFPEDAPKIIGPAWTLSYEMFFYLCFGLAMLAGLNRGLLILCVVFVAMIAAGKVLPLDYPIWKLATSTLLLEFLAGAAIGWLFVRNYLPERGGIILIFVALAMFAFGIFWGYDRLPSVIMWGLPSAFLIAGALITETSRILPIWVKKIGHFGDSSYALYLIHILLITATVQLAAWVPAIKNMQPPVAALLIAVVAVILAELLHYRVERPLIRWLNARRSLAPLRPEEGHA
jgi:exopolysaccharide production protein ExoZ